MNVKGIWSKLFGKSDVCKIEDDTDISKEGKRSDIIVRQIKDNDSDIQVSSGEIVCGYLLYPQEFQEMIDIGDLNPHEALEMNQPRFWKHVRQHNPQITIHLFSVNGTVDTENLEAALTTVGAFEEHSIIVGFMRASIDGGGSKQIFVGFCWKTPHTEMIITLGDKVAPFR